MLICISYIPSHLFKKKCYIPSHASITFCWIFFLMLFDLCVHLDFSFSAFNFDPNENFLSNISVNIWLARYLISTEDIVLHWTQPHFPWLIKIVFPLLICISYILDVNMDRVEDVLLHQKLLASARDPEKRPVYHIRFLEVLPSISSDFNLCCKLKCLRRKTYWFWFICYEQSLCWSFNNMRVHIFFFFLLY